MSRRKPARRRSSTRRRRRWPRVLLVLSLLAVLVAGLLAAGAWWAWRKIQEPYRDWGGKELVVAVEPGTGAAAILRQLEAAGVLADADLAQLYLVHFRGDPPLLAGEYRFDRPLTTPEVLSKLIEGDVLTHGVTVVEGLTLWETARVLADAGFGEYETFVEVMSSPGLIADLDPEATSLEGYLFPSTYSFRSGTSEQEVVATLVRTFKSTWNKQVAPRLAAAAAARPASPTPPSAGDDAPDPEATSNPDVSPDPEDAQADLGIEAKDPSPAIPEAAAPLSLREVVTLASIVEKEARLAEERPLIAGVYANRLRRGIALYADPTVIYALRLEGRWDGNIRRPDLKIDSPYNTYVRPGLPPGPIASPGLDSLSAAIQPAEVPHLYFVSRNDGSHVFSTTLAEHNRNVERWQKRYWRERWAEEKKGPSSAAKQDGE